MLWGRATARCAILVVALALGGAGSTGFAHLLTFTDTTLTLERDGSFAVELLYDLDALALGVPLDTDDATLVAALEQMTPSELDARIDGLRQLFARRVRIRFDGAPVPFDVAFPDRGTARASDASIPTLLGLTARLTGTVPAGADDVSFFASRAFADVHLTIIDRVREVETRMVLERGARSDPYPLAGPPPRADRRAVAARYLRLGFVHIVPAGLDHILFVVGLFLLSERLGALIGQVTLFTVAHACTLSAAALGLVSLPAAVVEPLIAASITYVAVENLVTDRVSRLRAAVVFVFGLLHGLGFAGVLGALGLPAQERLLALVTFNLGIELGQLTVLLGALGTIGWLRHRPWYRARIVRPLSATIAVVGAVWTLQRLLEGLS